MFSDYLGLPLRKTHTVQIEFKRKKIEKLIFSVAKLDGLFHTKTTKLRRISSIQYMIKETKARGKQKINKRKKVKLKSLHIV